MSVTQDRDGYLWIGTTAGLVRFDGYRFTPWRSDRFPSPNPVVYAVWHARDGSLWVALGGTSRIARDHNGELTVYTTGDGLPAGGVRVLLETADGTMLAGGPGGLVQMRNGRWEAVKGFTGETDTSVSALFEDRARNLWVSTEQGVVRRRAGASTFELVRTGVSGPVRFAEENGSIVLAGGSSIVRVNPDSLNVQTERISSAPTTSPFLLLVDSSAHLWVGTNGEGLFRIDRRGPPMIFNEKNGLSGDLVRALLQDREGNIWVGTQAGLTRLTEATIISAPTRTGTTSESISMLVADSDGTVWANAPDGLVQFKGNVRTVHRQAAGANLTHITALHSDGRGSIWVATGDGHVVRRTHGIFSRVTWPSHPRARITAITTDRAGAVWLFDGEQFFVLAGTNRISAVVVPAEFRNNLLRFAYADSAGRMWIGIDGGKIALYEGGTFRVYDHRDGIPEGNLSGIHEDRRRRIWISGDNGLSTFEKQRFVTLNTANGLPRDRDFSIMEDETGHLWVGASSGVLRIAREELDRALADRQYQLRYRFYDASDGLRGTPTRRGTPNAAIARDGKLWFVTSSGISVLNSRRVTNDERAPVPHIEQITINGRRTAPANGLVLPPGVSSLQIDYSALELTAPSKLRFRHTLDGIDANWVDNGDSRQASYAHLPAGRYTFRISATAIGNDNWSEQPALWTFAVQPMWYQTTLFYIGVVLMAAAGVWASWRLRVRQIRSHFAAVLAERARVGREIHDTLLQSLVGTALEIDNLSTELNKPRKAIKEELDRIRRQVDHYIGEAQQFIWDLRSPDLEESDLAATLRERLERITAASNLAFHFVTVGTPRRLPAHVQRQVVRIAQEAVVNAVRHAAASELRVELSYLDEAVHVRVVDNGRGFDLDAKQPSGKSHWGLSIMRERAEQIGGTFSISSGPDGGTAIHLRAPLAGGA
jgi:signal transduction histidine kinase/ligand-binding sensor domain-containing protein